MNYKTLDDAMAVVAKLGAEAETRSLTDDEVTEYEDAEAAVRSFQRTAAIRERASNLTSVQAPQVLIKHANRAEDTLERAFGDYLRTGVPNADLTELRAQSSGIGSEGGYLVPDGFRQKLVDRMVQFGGLAEVVETISTTSGNPLPFPTADDTGNVGEIVAEGGTFSSGADMTFGTKSLGAYSYAAGGGSSTPLRIPLELIQDAAFDIQAYAARKLGERIARLQATHWVSGTGVVQPEGIITGVTGVEIAADTAGITYDDLITFIHSVDPAYRDNARWAFNDSSLATIKKIKDSNGDPIWRPDSADMATSTGGGTLLGYPVTVDQAFPDFVANDNTINWGVFGDLREAYVIRRVRDIQVLVNPYTRMANRQIEMSAWSRADGAVQNPNSYIALTGEA